MIKNSGRVTLTLPLILCAFGVAGDLLREYSLFDVGHEFIPAVNFGCEARLKCFDVFIQFFVYVAHVVIPFLFG